MIFNLFKSKPTLKELIPKGFVDIHSHILPGIDDGAKNIKESKELISEMKKLGFSKIIGTPHTYPGLYNNTTASIKKAFDSVKKNSIENIEIGLSSEYVVDSYILEKAEKNDILTLKDNFILIETSFLGMPKNFDEIIFNLRMMDYIPVLAHPERYRFLHKNLKTLYKLKSMGCYFQLNLLSLVGYYGDDILKISDKLLEKNIIDFVGSDIHSKRHVIAFDKNISSNNIKLIENIIENNIKIFGW